MEVLSGAHAVAALALLGYLPGRLWVAVLLPRLQGWVARTVVSIALSVTMLVLALYGGYVRAGAPVSDRTAVAWSVAFTLVALGLLVGPKLAHKMVVAR